jgi:hypothetical protein
MSVTGPETHLSGVHVLSALMQSNRDNSSNETSALNISSATPQTNSFISLSVTPEVPVTVVPLSDIKQEVVSGRLNISERIRCRYLEEEETDIKNILNFLNYTHKKFRMRPLEAVCDSFIEDSTHNQRQMSSNEQSSILDGSSGRNSVIRGTRKNISQTNMKMYDDAGKTEQNSSASDGLNSSRKQYISHLTEADSEDSEKQTLDVEEVFCLLQVRNAAFILL